MEKKIHRQYDFILPSNISKRKIVIPQDNILSSKFKTGYRHAYGNFYFEQLPPYKRCRVWISDVPAGDPVVSAFSPDVTGLKFRFSLKWAYGIVSDNHVELQPDTEYYLNMECVEPTDFPLTFKRTLSE